MHFVYFFQIVLIFNLVLYDVLVVLVIFYFLVLLLHFLFVLLDLVSFHILIYKLIQLLVFLLFMSKYILFMHIDVLLLLLSTLSIEIPIILFLDFFFDKVHIQLFFKCLLILHILHFGHHFLLCIHIQLML